MTEKKRCRQGTILNDCPNCRKRTRKWIAVGPIDFCCRECAVDYVYKLEGHVSRDQHLLSAIKDGLEKTVGLRP